MKLTEISLEALYSKPKITKAVQDAIIEKENFDKIVPEYCEKICTLKCKSYEKVTIHTAPADVLIIQDYKALKDKYKSAAEVEQIHLNILRDLQHTYLKGLVVREATLLKCDIGEADVSKTGKAPLHTTLMKCSPYLLNEIKKANPKVIISLSTSVTKALGLPYSNYSNRGEIHGNVVLTLHPRTVLMIRQNSSGAMWGTDYWGVLERDFEKAGKLAKGELVVPDLLDAVEEHKKQVFVARNERDFEKYANEINQAYNNDPRTMFSWDTETTGLDPFAEDAKIITMQFGFRKKDGKVYSYVFPLWHRANTAYDPSCMYIKYLVPILTGKHYKVGHNAKFDVMYTYVTTGIRVKVTFDTMLLLHAINSGVQGNYGLKNAVWDWWPQSGLGGYEGLLPKLSTAAEIEDAA